ncbi:BREX-2 system adenine-specific DNA-methyltransferase PglX [Stieleria mannarensis]|uniref:BREX-2 system adenine-specific DNA-methyltransferase PglX n=1 Tax=Stieleria mannarensis TaxID=2755585 RepID=UPI00160248C3|nr:BREX-2 system adenine-specific DNA-methyltransferase PglX [Rhodopirellula sp. JC639]
MLDIKTLLPELKKLVTDLSADLLARSTAQDDPYSTEVDAGLREAYTQIEKGGRTADAFEVWREDYLDQVAVAWVLGCVFVRFMEDNRLIDECWLAGEGERRKLAEDMHELYFREHPHESDREYFKHVFREVGKIPACRDLFAEGKTPLWAVGPSGDMAMKLLGFWREIDAETGYLARSFEVEDGDTRFLGDLYQDLSERARKKYALLQTPFFVEEFILDRTLDPAIDEFGLDQVRMIDPTCGSGHFLLGGFARLFDLWIKREDNEVVAAQKAFDGVWGCDINPFAVAIARFRLIVAALKACGVARLKDAPAWDIHLATGDSLLFGNRWDREGKKKSEQQFFGTEEESWAPEIYACEDKEAISEVLGQQYHAVVGNPPYITVKDRVLNSAYRERYPSCAGKYSLSVPFVERFFDLCTSGFHGQSGYVGQITSNSFMKREFGKTLIEQFFPHIDLTHVLDTSGAYIPGHATPTVLLFGRNRVPQSEAVRAVLGIQGEPSTPANPAEGLVWKSIVRQVDVVDSEDEFNSTADVPRTTFSTHPWSLEGGGAADLKDFLESASTTTLSSVADIGIGVVTLEDDLFHVTSDFVRRARIPSEFTRGFVVGDLIRDWQLTSVEPAIFPHDGSTFAPVPDCTVLKLLWPYKTNLSNRKWFRKTQIERGMQWYEYGHISADKFRTPLSIVFAFVATHNHFVLDRGGSVFKQSAPVVKLSSEATEDEHLALLGFLNSSVACFWMKQVSQQKQMTAGDGIRISYRAQVPYEFVGTQLKNLPLPPTFFDGPLRDRLLALVKKVESLSARASDLANEKILGVADDGRISDVATLLDESEKERAAIKSAMVFLQEEIDFTCYAMFGLVNDSVFSADLNSTSVTLGAGERPFEIQRQHNVDKFAVPEEIPREWPSQLKDLWRERTSEISSSKFLSLIEDAHYKRRWRGRQGKYNHAARENERDVAFRRWMLERLESERYWPSADQHEPRLQSVAKLSDKVSSDQCFLQVANFYRGREDFDVSSLVSELVGAESVPFLPVLRYKPSGLRKRAVWEATWQLQRKEDAGEEVGEIKVPPKYSSADLLSSDYWRLRGKLDLPKERWISFPHCQTESDPSLVVGWAGWNHLQQATAIIAYYDARKREGWDGKRLTPLLAGLDQLLPWIHQWHPEVDPEFGETAGQSFQTMLEADAHELGLTLDEIRAWEPPKKAKTRRKRTSKGGRKKAEG